MRGASVYDTISVLNTFESEEEFESALDELIEWSLLLFDNERGYFDMHPIVRKYAYSRLSDKKKVHSIFRDYFIAKLPPERIRTMDDLATSIDLYYHTAKSGMYDAASEIYIKELLHPLFHRFGAYINSTELLRELFPDGLDKEPPIKDYLNKGEIISALGISYFGSGKSHLALDAFERTVYISDNFCSKKERIEARICLAGQQIMLGRLMDAEKNLRHNIKGKLAPAYSAELRASLGRLFAYEGLFTKSAFELNQALGTFSKLKELQAQCWIHGEKAHLYLFMKEPENALAAAKLSLELWNKSAEHDQESERHLISADWLIGSALTQMSIRDLTGRKELLSKAEIHLNRSLIHCRSINLVEKEPEILLAWAKWHFINKNIVQAQDSALDALRIAERCEYRLNKADLNNFLALLTLNNSDLERSIKYATAAHDLSLCDGKSHCYKPAMDNSNIIMESIRAKYKIEDHFVE